MKENKPEAKKEMGQLLEELGCTLLLGNREIGCATALKAGKHGFKHRSLMFNTPAAFKADGSLTDAAWKEIREAGILPAVGYGAKSSAGRLIARGATAAALTGAMFFAVGASDAMAGKFVYMGGTNPLEQVQETWPKPTFVDVDGDGDQDVFVGNGAGNIHYFENTGIPTAPVFVEKTGADNPLDGVGVGEYASPTFVDIDGDGDMDAFVGTEYAYYGNNYTSLSFFENTGTAQAPQFDWTVKRKAVGFNPLDEVQIENASPTFVDIDGDGDMDAFVGGDNGYIYSYKNVTGEAPPKKNGDPPITFEDMGPLLDDQNDPIYAYENAVPVFADIDGDGDMDLFVGSLIGNKYGQALLYYENTIGDEGRKGEPEPFRFTRRDGDANPLNVTSGTYTAPAIVDIDGDGLLDAFLGNNWFYALRKDGGPDPYDGLFIKYYQNTGTKTEPRLASRGDNPFNLGPASLLPAPALGDIDNDGDLDAVVGDYDFWWLKKNKGAKAPGPLGQGMTFYENTGDANDPFFAPRTEEDSPFNAFDPWHMPAPAFVDIDGDGQLDLFVGHMDEYDPKRKAPDKRPQIDYLKYITTTKNFEPGGNNPFGCLDLPYMPAPAFVDIDGDGDYDAFVAGMPIERKRQVSSTISFFLNDGCPITPNFIPITSTNPLSGTFGQDYSRLDFADIDGDGDFDMVMSKTGAVGRKDAQEFTGVRYFENTGNAEDAVFTEREGDANPFQSAQDKVIGGSPALGDIDGDGDIDAILGDLWGRLFYYRNVSTFEEIKSIIKSHGFDLCFVDTASSDKPSLVESCKAGLYRIFNFFTPS